MGYSVTYVNLLQRFNAWSVLLVTYWFRQVDEEIASAVLTAWLRHTDFLSPKFCFLSLTSDRVSLAEKKRLASAIMSKLALSVCYLHQQDLSSQSLPPQNFPNLRRQSDASKGFLHDDPAQWPTHASYQRLVGFVRNYRLANDIAEHFVQLATAPITTVKSLRMSVSASSSTKTMSENAEITRICASKPANQNRIPIR